MNICTLIWNDAGAIIKPGRDVLASLADAYLRFENDDAFGSGSVHWARRWNRAMQIHQARLGHANHTFVFLEDLIRQPDVEWARICQFLDLRLDTRLENACSQTIAGLEHEPWKRDAVSGLPQTMENKADDLFSTKFKLWLDDHLESYDNLRAKFLLSRNGTARGVSNSNSGSYATSLPSSGMSHQRHCE